MNIFKKVLILATLMCLITCSKPGPIVGTEGSRLVLVGVDGGSWNVIDPMLEAGELPNLQAIIDRGASGNLESVKPTLSPCVWTSVATGRTPENHGIVHFMQSRDAIKTPTVWELLSERGFKIGLYDYLVTWPPQAPPGGFMIPGWLRRDASVSPDDVFGRAMLDPYAYSMAGIYVPEDIVANCNKEMEQKPKYFNKLIETYQVDVAATIFYSVDATSHRFWHTSFPNENSPTYENPDMQDLVRKTVRGVDKAIGEIAAELGPNDVMLIVSDHGFFGRKKPYRHFFFHIPDWAELAGVDMKAEKVSRVDDWRMMAYKVDGEGDQADAAMKKLEETFSSALNSKGKPVFDVYSVKMPLDESLFDKEIQAGTLYLLNDRMKQDPDAYGFVWALPRFRPINRAANENMLVVNGQEMETKKLFSPNDFTGDHTKTGIFLAAGGPIENLAERIDLSVLDISSLMLYLANQPIPENLEGKLPTQLFSQERLSALPPQSRPPVEAKDLDIPDKTPGEDQLLERLRSLGYIQ